MARVLVIDDDKVLREVLRHQLAVSGHEVTLARHGGEGLEAAARRDFDAAVVDLFMPEVEGFETIRHLRRAHPRLAIVAITGGPQESALLAGHGGVDYLEVARLLGAARTLRKPFSAAAIGRAVAESIAEMKSAGP
ncbi:MAG: response regulator [Alphaproteobacteria bacterium]|nr:response regulator [Alphaproteobacteria bacterium]